MLLFFSLCAQQFRTLFSLGQQDYKIPLPEDKRENKAKRERVQVLIETERKMHTEGKQASSGAKSGAKSGGGGGGMRDLQGSVRAEVWGGRSKAVISRWIRGVHYRARAGGRRDEGWRRRRRKGRGVDYRVGVQWITRLTVRIVSRF